MGLIAFSHLYLVLSANLHGGFTLFYGLLWYYSISERLFGVGVPSSFTIARSGRAGEGRFVTLNDAMGAFLLALEAQGRSMETIETYRIRLASFVELYGDWKLKAVGPAEVDSWVVAQRRQKLRYENHPTRPTLNSGISKATIAGRVQSIKSFFRWCHLRGHLPESPAAHLKQERYDPSAESRAMAPADFAAMLSIARSRAKKGNPRDYAILCFLGETGARLGEIASLRLGNLRLEKLEATIEGKTGKGVVDFTPLAANALRDWLAVRPSCDSDRVFVSITRRTVRPLTQEGIYQVLKRLAKDAGVRGRFNPHAIRHLVGQSWSDEVNLELVRQKLRHKDIATTARHYANQDRARLKQATHRLSLLRSEDEEDKEV